MPRTKHLVLILCLVVVALVLLTLFLLIRKDKEDRVVENQSALLVLASPEMRVEVSGGEDKQQARESLIARLRGQGARVASSEPEGTNVREQVGTGGDVPVTSEESNSLQGDVSSGGLISSMPQEGALFACDQQTETSAPDLPWVGESYWYPEKKVTVDGSVTWEDHVTITVAEGARVVASNGLPNHGTGVFPIHTSDDALPFESASTAILPETYSIQLAQNPSVRGVPHCVPKGMVGIALNGVAIYSALDEKGYDAVKREVFDNCSGHPSLTGAYHYHSESPCLTNAFYEGAPSTLLGYALDGFGLFSSLEEGKKVTNTDLDQCHGHVHTIPWNGEMVSMYHYHMTDEFPYTIGCFMGDPVVAQ